MARCGCALQEGERTVAVATQESLQPQCALVVQEATQQKKNTFFNDSATM